MNNFDRVAKELRTRAQRLLTMAEELGKMNPLQIQTSAFTSVSKKRHLSKAARQRIAIAQRRRWAQVRKTTALASKK